MKSLKECREKNNLKGMKLDRYTKEGQKFIGKERETAKLVSKHYGIDISFTKFDAEKFDAFMYSKEKMVGVMEIKTRPFFNRKLKTPCTLDLLRREGYLITAEKLDILQDQSLKNEVTSYIFVNLPNDRKILCFKVTNSKGVFFFDYERRISRTAYSCNDYKGDTDRVNAFIPIAGNKHFEFFSY